MSPAAAPYSSVLPRSSKPLGKVNKVSLGNVCLEMFVLFLTSSS
jgi:hypothetical protein